MDDGERWGEWESHSPAGYCCAFSQKIIVESGGDSWLKTKKLPGPLRPWESLEYEYKYMIYMCNFRAKKVRAAHSFQFFFGEHFAKVNKPQTWSETSAKWK